MFTYFLSGKSCSVHGLLSTVVREMILKWSSSSRFPSKRASSDDHSQSSEDGAFYHCIVAYVCWDFIVLFDHGVIWSADVLLFSVLMVWNDQQTFVGILLFSVFMVWYHQQTFVGIFLFSVLMVWYHQQTFVGIFLLSVFCASWVWRPGRGIFLTAGVRTKITSSVWSQGRGIPLLLVSKLGLFLVSVQ